MQEFEELFGKIQILESTKEFGSSVLIINPGREINRHYHKKTREVEMILEGQITSGNKLQKPGDVNIWNINQKHGYKNSSDKVVKILCITYPSYDSKDVFE